MNTITNSDLAIIFDQLFDKYLTEKLPHHQVYELAERDFKQRFNHRKYSSFDSYRQCRRDRIRKHKMQ